MSDFEKFETNVIKQIITEDSTIAEKLLLQYKSAKVIKREFTGVGFYTDFEIQDKSTVILTDFNSELGSLHVTLPELKYGIGFVLFIRNGFISLLEGYTYGEEQWPDNITEYTFYKVNEDGTIQAL